MSSSFSSIEISQYHLLRSGLSTNEARNTIATSSSSMASSGCLPSSRTALSLSGEIHDWPRSSAFLSLAHSPKSHSQPSSVDFKRKTRMAGSSGFSFPASANDVLASRSAISRSSIPVG